jgi:5'-3' exonuclease
MGQFTFINEDGKETKNHNTLLFDAHNLIHRTIFVAANEMKKIHSTGAEELWDQWKFILLRSMLGSIIIFKPTRVVFALDAKNNWRKKIYPDYKNKRNQIRKESVVDFDAFYPVMNEFMVELREAFDNIYILECKNCEGDDVIAAYIKKIQTDGEITIVSADKDMKQLLTHKNVKLFDPMKKEYINIADPVRDLNIQVIMGDRSDCIPAINDRVGIKTAAKILDSGLEEYILENDVQANYDRNRKLIDLDMIPTKYFQIVESDFENYDIGKYDSMKVYNMFRKYRFNTLIENFQKYDICLRKVENP